MDHDQRFKTLLQIFFADFLRLFFAPWAERLDCAAAEWLDKEIFPDPPEGPRRTLDLLARVKARQAIPGMGTGQPESWLALIHIEIESPDRAAPVRPRMFADYVHLRHKYGLPILPIVLYLHVGMDGVGVDVYEEHFWEFRAIHFQYMYVGLPALNALEYLEGDNILGVALAALMKVPKDKVAWLGAEALRKIKDAPLTDQQRFYLGECIHAYLPLDDAAQAEFESLLASRPYEGVKAMNITPYDKGQRELVRDQLENRFGPLSEEVLERFRQFSQQEILRIARAFHQAPSLRELGLENGSPSAGKERQP